MRCDCSEGADPSVEVLYEEYFKLVLIYDVIDEHIEVNRCWIQPTN